MKIYTYRAIIKRDKQKTRTTISATHEHEARALICQAHACEDSAIIDIKQNGPTWSELKPEQLKVCALFAFYLFNHHNTEPHQRTGYGGGEIAAARHACGLFNVPNETVWQIEDGMIKGLPNLNRLSGGEFTTDYLWNI
jgi:hypothetical protein